jgi:ankyrin repeat protein
MLKKLKAKDLVAIQLQYSDLINYDADDISEPIDPLFYKDSGGDSLLHIATIRNDVDTVMLILKTGFNPNIKGDMGNTPLHYAAMQNNLEIFNLLQEHGGNADIPNQFGSLPKLSDR